MYVLLNPVRSLVIETLPSLVTDAISPRPLQSAVGSRFAICSGLTLWSWLGPIARCICHTSSRPGIFATVSQVEFCHPLVGTLFTTTTCGFCVIDNAGAPEKSFTKPWCVA